MGFPTLDAYLWRPVTAGMWRQRELTDGTYDFSDLLDAHEFLDVKEDNAERFNDWKRSQSR